MPSTTPRTRLLALLVGAALVLAACSSGGSSADGVDDPAPSAGLDDATIAVALLHDTIEDTDATRAEIDQMFGPEIGAIVESYRQSVSTVIR